MRCNHCGKDIPDTYSFCLYCGKPTGAKPQDELAYLVSLAREGNQEAVSELYEKTYSKVYYTVKSMIKDEDAVLDIVQDTYIKAFTRLSGFEGNDKFLPWVKQIAANTARDYFKKKRPTLFTDIAPNEGDTPAEELFADERGAYIPEQVIDENETKRLMREIIDDLPEDQRAVIGMYYYEELSVREIAEALGATESAVKSRLMYGRKKIEKNVRELEKKGTKLYGLAPIPFLLLLFRNQNASASGLANGQILQKVLESTANAANAAPAASGAATVSSGTAASSAAAGTIASAIGSLGVVKLTLIALVTAIVAGTVIGAGVVGITRMGNGGTQDGNVTSSASGNTSTATSTAEPAAQTSPLDEAMEQYRIIIENASSYQYDPYGVNASGNYRYALVQMQPADPVPTLLLEQEDTEYMYYMRAFLYDTAAKTVHQPPENLMEGVARTGGYRGFIDMAADGNGLLLTEISSGTGSTTITRAAVQGDVLVQTREWSGRMDMIPSSYDTTQIDWHDISDLSALAGQSAASPQTGTQAASTQAASAAAPTQVPAPTPTAVPTDGNRTVLSGTVGTYSYDGVLRLQGISDPNPGSSKSGTYVLIVLDTPQTISAMDGDGVSGTSSHSTEIIDVTIAPGMSQYSGQHITFSIDPHNTYWPSDASVPLGVPDTSDIHVLN